MNAAQRIRERQRQWALGAGHSVDAAGYVPSIEANLWRPLHPQTRQEFEEGKGSELRERKNGPAKMRALHSSAALACNVFDFWRDRDKTGLGHALGLESAVTDLRFEMHLPTGLEGNPPNLDVFLTLESGEFVAVESKFTEQYAGKSSAAPFKRKYFPAGAGLWAKAGLPQCQALAGALDAGGQTFNSLNVAQLLKHALGAATNHRDSVTLVYLFYDDDGPEGVLHRQDVATLTDLLGGEVNFRALPYQQMFQHLVVHSSADSADYVDYLRTRYFAE